MFRLREQIRSYVGRIRTIVGQHDNFARPGNAVDIYGAEHIPLGQSYINVARPDDLVRGSDRLRPISERSYGLSSAHAVDFADAASAAATRICGLMPTAPAVAGGVTITISGTPATCAGMAFISTEEG